MTVDLADADAVYTNSQFPDGQTFGSISVGTGVTVDAGPMPGDLDEDGDVDLDDYVLFSAAMAGPDVPISDPDADLVSDTDCDLADAAIFAANFTGSL